MKLFKGALAAALALTMTACSTTPKEEAPKEAEPIKVLTPLGAPSLSMLGLYGDEKVTLDTVDGSDTLQAELAKSDGDYDMIVAPINLGAKMITSGKSGYTLSHVVTWGNLYIVGTDDNALDEEGEFAVFGEKAVPQIVLNASMDLSTIKATPQYFNSVNDVQAQLLTGKAKVGLMAEPAATATIAKAKEKNIELKIIKDLQEEYKAKNNLESNGYPQAALFVKKGSEDKVASYIETATTFADEAGKNSDKIKSQIEIATAEKLGIPNAEIAVKTWERQNIHIKKASDVKTDVETFLKQFKIEATDDLYTK